MRIENKKTLGGVSGAMAAEIIKSEFDREVNRR